MGLPKRHPSGARGTLVLACQRLALGPPSRGLLCAALLAVALLVHVTLLTGWEAEALRQHFFLAKYTAVAWLGLGPRAQRPVTLASAQASLGGVQPVSVRSAAVLAHQRALLDALVALRPAAGASGVRLAVRERVGFTKRLRADGNEPWEAGAQERCPVPCTLLVGEGAAGQADALVDFEPCVGQLVDPSPPALPLLSCIQENFYLTSTASSVGAAAGAGGGALAHGGARTPLGTNALAVLRDSQWLSSYELDSHVPLPYLKEVRALLHWQAPLPREALGPRLRFAQRIPAIAAFVSNCDLFSSQPPPRALYIRELAAHYPVHHYGRCNSSMMVGGQLGRVRGEDAAAAAAAALGGRAEPFQGALDSLALGDVGSNTDKLRILSAYRYAIAMENSQAYDYVSEKVYEALAAGAVPVYLGAPNVRDLIPDAAAIVHVRDFESPGALGAYLHRLDAGGEGAWLAAHHEWRAQAVPQSFRHLQVLADYRRVPLACRVCACAAGHLGCPFPHAGPLQQGEGAGGLLAYAAP